MNNKYFPRKGNPLKLTENILSTFWFELWRSKFWNRIIQSLAWSLSSLTKGSKAKHWRDGVRSICWERKINYVENCCEGIFTKKDFHKIQPTLCIERIHSLFEQVKTFIFTKYVNEYCKTVGRWTWLDNRDSGKEIFVLILL